MPIAWIPLAVLAAALAGADGTPCECPRPSFGVAPRSYYAGAVASDVGAIGDANGDGRPDFILARHTFTGTVLTMLNDGRGGLLPPLLSELGQGGDRAITTADLNGDGRLDVLLAGGQANPFVSAGLGDGAGGFALSWHAFLGSEPSSLATGDFDEDGRPDLAVTATGSGHVAILRGRGDGTFESPFLMPAGSLVADVVAADWNQDGHVDLAYVEPWDARIVVRAGDGTGAFGAPVSFDVGPGPSAPRTADLDGDGRLDFVVSRPNAQAITVLRGLSGGGFAPRTDHPTGLQDVLSYALADLDGDGRLDLALSRRFFLAGDVHVMRGAPGPGFQAPIRRVLGFVGEVHLADFDADGRLDAGVVAGRSMMIARGLGDGSFEQAPSVPTSGEPHLLVAAPLDGDARPDLLIAQPNAVVMRRNDGMGGFGGPTTVAVPGMPRTMPIADLDGDSDLDVVIDVNPSVAVVGLGVLLNDGNGGLALGETELAGILLTAAALGDLDEDGFIDAVATDSIDPFPVLWVFRGGPNATFQPAFSVPLAGDAPNGVQVADLNGDANLDVVAGHLFSDDVEVLLGNGAGGLSAGIRYPAPGAAGVVVADVNEDGIPDLVTGGAVLLGNGTGAFPTYSLLPAGIGGIVPIDVTLDGHLDLVGGLGLSTVGVMEGDGTGAFLAPLEHVTASFASGIAALDLDGDTRPEIVTSSRYTNQVTILRNTACRPARLELTVDVGGPFDTGQPFPRQPVLEVHDDGGNRLACATGEVTASIAAGTGAPGAVLRGDVTSPVTSGEAAFVDLAVDRAGAGYRVEFRHPQTNRKRSGSFDVALPRVSLPDAPLDEGDVGIQLAAFRLALSGPSGLPVTVSYSTRDGTALAGSDYQNAVGTVTFAPGQVERIANVVVFGDTAVEADEFFHLDAAGAVHATLATSSARGRILDDDGGGLALAEASHGTDVVRALPAGTQPRHLYLVAQQPRSSYEAIVDGASGDLGPGDGPALRRLASDLSTVIQDSVPIGGGAARGLAWQRGTATSTESEYVEVASRGCTTDCGLDDAYRLRFRETTGLIPRFNNAGGQLTVVLLQNPGTRPVSGTVWFWDAIGVPLAEVPFSAPARGMFTLATAGTPGLEGASGTITVSHDGGYGTLVGKAVSLQPSTGFSFDTAMVSRAR